MIGGINQADLVLSMYYIVLGMALVIPILSIRPAKNQSVIIALAWIGVIASAIANGAMTIYTMQNGIAYFFNGAVQHDVFTSFILLGSSLTAALALLSAGREPILWESRPAYYSLLPLVLFGIFVIAGAADTVVVLASWLLLSVLAYVYIAIPTDVESRAAAVRYILLGAVATLFLVLWLVYNTAVATSMSLYPYSLAPLTTDKVSALALVAVLAALGFKTGIAPFHWWVPSVYGRADGRVVGVVAGVIKLGFIALIARLVYYMAGGGAGSLVVFSISHVSYNIAIVLAVLAIITMTYGNIAALTTNDLRALLAYSSIAHIGYILAAIAALAYFAPRDPTLTKYALAAIAVQAVAYGMAKAPLFSLTSNVRTVQEIRGLLGRNKLAGGAAAVLLFSLLGMPPMLGFWGKLYMFIAAAGFSLLLVVIAFINSAISSAYYVRMARDISSEHGESTKKVAKEVEVSLVASALLIILFGLIAPLLFGIIF